jgi:hypothetical protein
VKAKALLIALGLVAVAVCAVTWLSSSPEADQSQKTVASATVEKTTTVVWGVETNSDAGRKVVNSKKTGVTMVTVASKGQREAELRKEIAQAMAQ